MTSGSTLLDGRVQYRQIADGYRTGIEPVLLAASVPAKPGQTVVEAGAGAGAGLLCLAARVPGIACLGIELDPATAAQARQNFADNDLTDSQVITADIANWAATHFYHHAMANPPWHSATDTKSSNLGRDRAKRAHPGLCGAWAAALARGLRPRGTLSLILPARHLAEGVAAMSGAGCPEITIIPLWPKRGRQAKLMILRGVKAGKGPCIVHPGLLLHEDNGDYSKAAEAILRSGQPLL